MTLLSTLYPNIKSSLQGTQGIQGLSVQGTSNSIQGLQGKSIPKLDVNTITSSYTLQSSDIGKLIRINSGVSTVTIPSSTFTTGNSFLLYNEISSTITVSAGIGVSLHVPGNIVAIASTTLVQNELTTILCSSHNNEFIISSGAK
jgi:hypothetical protein